VEEFDVGGWRVEGEKLTLPFSIEHQQEKGRNEWRGSIEEQKGKKTETNRFSIRRERPSLGENREQVNLPVSLIRWEERKKKTEGGKEKERMIFEKPS